MPASSVNNMPKVSIILPTYNRATFLPQAFASICGQTFTDWELLVVDDGSTDTTRDLVAELTRGWEQPVRYVYQENQGAYGARNAGLDLAAGAYIAFFDSDDLWLPHHLADCVMALETNPDVDWVYGACRVVEYRTGRELQPSSFYVQGRPRPFLALRIQRVGPLCIIEDRDAVRCQILYGLYCGLQNSVIRRRVFSSFRFQTCYRNEAQDQLLPVRALKAGHRLGYFDKIHVIYHEHDDNSSAAGANQQLEKKLLVYQALIRGYEELRETVPLTPAERRALNRRLSREYFWTQGYALLWQHGRRREALQHFRKGLQRFPWDWRLWKTYVLCRVRTAF